ncbi:hypothetical protein HZQ32_17070 [Elizabethkingia anophelis]|nr:hypothetical protein [Elizabethkingia anophelis]
MDKPKILTLNLTEKACKLLMSNNFNITEGSLGKTVDISHFSERVFCLPGHNIPNNLHEFDIIIVDLSNEEIKSYIKEEHIKEVNKTGEESYLLCEPSMTLFDPRGVSVQKLLRDLKECYKKEFMLIVFQNEREYLPYNFFNKKSRTTSNRLYSCFDFIPSLPVMYKKTGFETIVVEDYINSDFQKFLSKYSSEYIYHNIFEVPEIRVEESGKYILNPHFFPLLTSNNNEVISYIYGDEKSQICLFPEVKDNSTFLLEFLQEIAPSINPNVFPFSTQTKWTVDPHYALPNHMKLEEEKQELIKEYEEKIALKDDEIKNNEEEYKFLHNILTETGDSLVSAIIQYLNWLGFENVVDMDEKVIEGNVKEEDIQIETSKGLLVIEVKGIGGTSKDSECSQIAKIKYRRSKERGEFDVFGLYIVNHQRHLPALRRRNPPFTAEQLSDAIHDERGLLTTWQLFNSFYEVESGIITKEQVRERFYDYGLIDFKSKDFIKLPGISEVFKNGSIIILTLENTKIKKGDHIFFDSNGQFERLQILEIQFNNQPIDEIENGEVGIKFDKEIKGKATQLYIKL